MEMNRIFKYYKNRKGITLVLMALMLAVLLMLAGLAIDIAYMYYVKNQLQVAADAAALAGAARLDPVVDNSSSAYSQLEVDGEDGARKVAWKFACKNRAAGQSVYLVTNSSTDCDSPPVSGLNETDNNTDGDIVVGHWRSTNDVACQTTWESAGSGFFCRANGNTGLTINALKARPRRTNETPGMPRVSLFIGQIINWSRMSASASAIAAPNPPFIGPFPICLPSCNRTTPLNGQWGYDKNAPALVPPIPEGFKESDNVRLCSDTDSTVAPFGQEFYLQPSNDADRPGFAWTNFDLSDLTECDATAKCNNNPDPGEITPYITGAKQPPPICGKAICITNGTATGPVLSTLATEVANHNSDSHEVSGTSINGWIVTVPVVLDCAGNQACPGDPTGRPYPVQNFATIIITDIISSGDEDKKGMRLVGLNNAKTITYTCEGKNKKDPNVTRTRFVTTIGPDGVCPSCSSPLSGVGATPHLVK